MNRDLKVMSFTVACNTYFGRKPGQCLHDFVKELDRLTPTEKTELILEFKKHGVLISERVPLTLQR